MKQHFLPLALLAALCCAAQCRPALAAPALRDHVSFTTFENGSLLQHKGWKTVHARTGGWGIFPTSYSYRVLDVEGNPCLTDAYMPAQYHGHSNAIPLDWDGDPANGQTPLRPEPGLSVAFQVSVYLQPYSKGWGCDGTGRVIWSFGPGHWDGAEAAGDDSNAAYDWSKGRGPRLQYRMGFDIEGKEVPLPVLRGLSPESAAPAVDGPVLPAAGAWYDLRLTITFSDGLKCALQARPRGAAAWNDAGAWTTPLAAAAGTAANPATWNALFLDMPLGVWSKKGYGQPTPEMLDRYDDFVVEALPAGAAGQPRKAKLLMFDRPDVAGFVRGPKTLFADEGATWNVLILNNSGNELAGRLSLRQKGRPAVALDPTCRIPDQSKRTYTKRTAGAFLPGDGALQVVLADAAGRERVFGSAPVQVLAQKTPRPGVNMVRNAGFELGATSCGTPMRQGDEFFQRFVKQGEKMAWTQAPTEAWWVEGPSAEGVTVAAAAHSGKAGLSVKPAGGQPRSAISALNRMVPPGPVTLSAWVKTAGCKGHLEFDLATSWEQVNGRGSVVRKSLPLPANSDWTRLILTSEAPQLLHALGRIVVEEGAAVLDDVQIEAGAAASAFNLRPEEWLRLSIAGTPDARLPQWIAADPAVRKATVTNDSRVPIGGQVRLFLGPWNKPTAQQIAAFEAGALAPGASRTFTFRTGALPANAYVLCLSLDGKGAANLPAQWSLATDQTLGGTVSNGMLRSRSAARFLIAPRTRPAQWFGVGNSMLDTNGSWFSGYGLAAYCEARPLGLTGIRTGSNEENLYLAAAVGAPIHAMSMRVDLGVPEGAPFANPASPSAIDVFHPEGFAYFTRRAEEVGKEYAASPMMASYQMSNESPYLNGGALCPSPFADAAFRAWCRKRFGGDLNALNAAWRTSYAEWNEVEQISSARFLEEEKRRPRKEGAAAIDWTASTGTFSPQVQQRMRENSGRAMDWLRWRTEASIWMYSTFRETARKHDKKTLYGTNLCWPAFWPQMFMPFTRAMDNTQLDIQYTSGLPRALGTPYEMMDSLEMAESSDPTKPVWGIEIYVQPQWPAAYTALQNWGLLAHGMTNNLVFAWKPYSDHGPVKGTRAWEKPDAHPMWFLIDNDGTRLPHYDFNARSLKEIRAYHARHNGLSVRRAPTPVAFYVSPDTAEYVVLETANKPWGSFWQRTRNTLIYLLRMGGIAVEYVDDATLPAAPGKYTTVIVPAAYVLNQSAAGRLASFARAGGTVLLAGPAGVVDPWLNRYETVGGPAWAELGWKAPAYAPDFAKVAFARGVNLSAGGPSATEKPGTLGGAIDATVAEGKTFRGVNLGEMAGAAPINDGQGTTVGWQRPWGKGKLIAYGIFPDSYATDPHPPANMTAWLQQVIRLAGLPIAGRWVSKGAARVAGAVGSGSAVVEVVVRQKSPSERFLFCMNQGGAGEGTVEARVGAGTWRAEDAITGKALAGAQASAGTWRLPMRLEAWGYRVVRLVRQGR